MKLNAKQLRKLNIDQLSESDKTSLKSRKKKDIYLILDNVLDTYNIGSIFRLADAVGAQRVILCGGSETPPNHRIKKASINTTEITDWQYFESAEKAIISLKKELPEIKIVSIELTDRSVQYDTYEYNLPLALVVGHETDGVSKEALQLSDAVVEIPMHGINVSLNVMVSLAIVLYKTLES